MNALFTDFTIEIFIHAIIMYSSWTSKITVSLRSIKNLQSMVTVSMKWEKRTERKQGKTRRSNDGTWTKKNSVSHFGNKLHTVQGTDIPLIREFVVTTASLHDSQIDLGIPGIPNYRERRQTGNPSGPYFGIFMSMIR